MGTGLRFAGILVTISILVLVVGTIIIASWFVSPIVGGYQYVGTVHEVASISVGNLKLHVISLEGSSTYIVAPEGINNGDHVMVKGKAIQVPNFGQIIVNQNALKDYSNAAQVDPYPYSTLYLGAIALVIGGVMLVIEISIIGAASASGLFGEIGLWIGSAKKKPLLLSCRLFLVISIPLIFLGVFTMPLLMWVIFFTCPYWLIIETREKYGVKSNLFKAWTLFSIGIIMAAPIGELLSYFKYIEISLATSGIGFILVIFGFRWALKSYDNVTEGKRWKGKKYNPYELKPAPEYSSEPNVWRSCDHCGSKIRILDVKRCIYCRRFFCEEHALPKSHNCPNDLPEFKKEPNKNFKDLSSKTITN